MTKRCQILMMDQRKQQEIKRRGSSLLYDGSEGDYSVDEEHGEIVQTTKSKGIVNVQLFIRSK